MTTDEEEHVYTQQRQAEVDDDLIMRLSTKLPAGIIGIKATLSLMSTLDHFMMVSYLFARYVMMMIIRPAVDSISPT